MRALYDVDIPSEGWSEFGLGGRAGSSDGVAWVSPPGDQPVAVGAALAWASRHGADRLQVVVFTDLGDGTGGGDLGAVARRAALFDPPAVVTSVDGNEVSVVAPDPPEAVRVPAPSAEEQRLLLQQAGVEVVVEEGDVVGQVLGLEIARVVVDGSGAARLEVGVGRFDREAFALLHGEMSPPDALAKAVAEVSAVRRSGAEPHPMNRVARERWLRHHLVTHPELVGAAVLGSVDGARPREGLRDAGVAVALGARPDGTPVVVASSVGVDLEAVPDAADARLRHAPGADLVLAVPPRDLHQVTLDLAGMLERPAEVIGIEPPWPS